MLGVTSSQLATGRLGSAQLHFTFAAVLCKIPE